MNEQERLGEVIRYWLEKAKESLSAAQDEMKAGRLSFAVNRIYYALFLCCKCSFTSREASV